MAHPYVQAWQRLLTGTGTVIGTDTASNGTVTVPTATANGEVGVSPKIGNLLIGVFALKVGSTQTFSATTKGWVVVRDLIEDVHVIVCHKIVEAGAGANNFTLSWTGVVPKYWYAAVAEYSGIGAITKFQNSNYGANGTLTGTSACACGSADLVTSDGGYVISILSIEDETQAGMDVTEDGFFVDYNFDFSNGTTYPGTTLPQSIFASVERNATGTETATWDWTNNRRNTGVILTYGKAGGAAVDDWSFNHTTAVSGNATGIGGQGSASTVTADSSGGNYTVIGVPVSAGSALHTSRWWLKKGAPFVGSVDITLDYDTAPGAGAGATWSTVPNNFIGPSTGEFSQHVLSGTVANPRIALRLSNASDKIIIGNAELFLNTNPARLEGAPHIYTNTAAVTEQVQTEVTYGAVITNGTTPDASWVAIPDNSRLYPMNEGTGTQFDETINDAVGPAPITGDAAGGWATGSLSWEQVYTYGSGGGTKAYGKVRNVGFYDITQGTPPLDVTYRDLRTNTAGFPPVNMTYGAGNSSLIFQIPGTYRISYDINWTSETTPLDVTTKAWRIQMWNKTASTLVEALFQVPVFAGQAGQIFVFTDIIEITPAMIGDEFILQLAASGNSETALFTTALLSRLNFAAELV